MTEPIIDVWIQHPTGQFLGHEMFASLRRWMKLGAIPEEIPIEFTMSALDAAGVTRALVSAWWSPTGPLLSNDEVAKAVKTHPDRLIGIGSVDLHRPMDAVRELRRCVKELGFVGVRLLPWLWGLPPNDRRYYPIYAECVELDIPFCLQVGHAGPLRPSDPGRPIPYLDEVACDFPELRIVGGHIGYPWTDEMIALATKYENVYIDTSAYTPERYPEALVRFMRGPGRRKVLFGSNWPMIPPDKCIGQLDMLDLSDEGRRAFLHENAVEVFKLG
ncbi:MAG: amidohydrolase family protein [Deltaproteobacteria bacterium]|nr:amidohydrolase family protein [Deltaproteobacteria bacterium]